MSAFTSFFEEKYNPIRSTSFIVQLKKNKNGELDDLIAITSFLDEFYESPAVTQRLYHYVKQDFLINKCPICSKPIKYREKPNPSYLKTCGEEFCIKKQNCVSTKQGMKEKYGVENISQTAEWREKVKRTNLERRGVMWNTQAEEFIKARDSAWQDDKEERLRKKKETNVERYGHESPTQNDVVKRKLIDTIKSSYEFNVLRKDRIMQTNQEKYGVDWFMCSNSFKEKSKETLFSRYGVVHNSHNSDTLDKRWKKSRSHIYVFPSGRIAHVQGYEPKCIDELLESDYAEDDIIVGNAAIERWIGKITYIGYDKNLHRYYPDIYIPSLNKVIEVKSPYTLSKDLEINNKQKAVTHLGFDYELKVY